MNILVLYELGQNEDRNTINDHLYSFKRYQPQNNYHYINVNQIIPKILKRIKYDVVILHYTYLAGSRFLSDSSEWERKTAGLEDISGFKVAIPQDEYDHSGRLCELFKKIKVDLICTCFYLDEDIELAYPEEIVGSPKFLKVLTGYVNPDKLTQIGNNLLDYKDRPIDIGYRARKLPPHFGKHGQLKYELVELFNKVLVNRSFIYDINSTNKNFKQEDLGLVKMGNSWYEFLLSCKSFIGCEGGSSLLDSDGSIKEATLTYLEEYPDASFEEVEKACFPNMDYNISCFAISPRHFEAGMTKTLQILVEGHYGGIFKPWRHYLPLKKDFSNVNEILEKLGDNEFCQNIVDRTYLEIVLNEKFSYKSFVGNIYSSIVTKKQSPFETLNFKFYGAVIYLRNFIFSIFVKMRNYYFSSKVIYGLYKIYSKARDILKERNN